MTNWFPKQRLINPTRAPISPLLSHILEMKTSYKAFNVLDTVDPETQESVSVMLTHSWFTFEKPLRYSKAGRRKTNQTYISVYHPQSLGQGMTGVVYPVECSLTKEKDSWVVKTKEHKRAVKSSTERNSTTLDFYTREQEVGQFVPHMGYRYAPTTDPSTNQSYLLMNLIPGVSLESIIERCKKDPNYLSVKERLLITISLLKALPEQVHNNELPQLGYVIHQDIKHGNIIVTKDWGTKLIDFGLGRFSHDHISEKTEGTPLYMDTQVIQKIIKPSAISDYASASRVIAELWGDTSESTLNDFNELIRMNKRNRMKNLLVGINGLQEEDKVSLTDTLNQMNRYQIKDRLPRVEALGFFEQFLNEYQPVLDPALAKLAQETPFSELSSEQIIAVLNSDASSALIARLTLEPKQFSVLMNQLGAQIIQVHEAKLHQLKAAACDFSTLLISKDSIPGYNAAQLHLLLSLGAQLAPNCLQEYLESAGTNKQQPLLPERLVSICKVLYEYSDKQTRNNFSTQNMSPTTRTFYTQLLQNNQINHDSHILLHSFEYYLSANKYNGMLMAAIKTKLTKIKDTAFAAKISAILLEFPEDQIAFTTYDILRKINNALCTIHECQMYLAKNKHEALEQSLNAICALKDMSFEEALAGTATLNKQLIDIMRDAKSKAAAPSVGFFANSAQGRSQVGLSRSNNPH